MFIKFLNNNCTLINTSILLVLVAGVLYAPSLLAQSCGDSLFADVTLTADMNCTDPALTHALEVRADNITIDLNGHTISGWFGIPAIVINGYNNVSVKNGVLKNFLIGIDTLDTNGLEVTDTIFLSTTSGLILSSGSHADIYANQFILGHETAIEISNHTPGKVAMHNVIVDNEFYKPYAAVHICGLGTAENTIKNNFVWQSIGFGFVLEDTTGNEILHNEVLESDASAIRLDNSSSNLIINNSLRTGGFAGLAIYADDSPSSCLDSGDDFSVFNNFEYNHSIDFQFGVILNGTDPGLVYKNDINDNKLYDDDTGIYFNSKTYANNGENNAYHGTTVPIVDLGVDNSY